MTQIKLTELTKTFPGRDRPSVDALTLDIATAEFLCLLGPSGCGKTTTLRAIAGLEQPSFGRIEIGDNVVDDVALGKHVRAEARGLGFVFQNYALWPHLTVAENVGFGPVMQRVPRKQRESQVSAVLEKLGITEHANRYPSALSGGQQQRVAIARTLAANPKVMLLDEPLSNLDARLRLDMRAEFQRIHRESGTTMVFVTHDQFEAMTLATRIAVMDQGVLQQVGTPLEIYHQPVNRFVAEFIGSPPINILETSQNHPAATAMAQWAQRRNSLAASAGIRPEALQIAGSGDYVPPEAFSVELSVTALLPTGHNWIIELEDGGQRMFATSTELPPFEVGEEVSVWARPQNIHLFDAEGSALTMEKVQV